jgi:ABC-type uncharacterized transport system substrate-binding protein
LRFLIRTAVIIFICMATIIILSEIPTNSVINVNAGNVNTNNVNIDNVNTKPITNNGKKWRIGYVEGQPYSDFASALYYLTRGLDELGWLSNTEGMPYTEGQDDSSEMWNWLSKQNFKYIQFVPDAYFSIESMKEQPGISKEDIIVNRLRANKDIDLMIAMGTLGGMALANDRHKTPVLDFVASDPVGAGMVFSVEDSGRNNFWAQIDPNQLQRQVEVFHDIVSFKKLGLVYENNTVSRSIAGISQVEAASKEKGFKLISQYVYGPADYQDYTRYYQDMLEANKKLARKVDAMLITMSDVPPADLTPLLKPFIEKKIPTFSQAGSMEVNAGVLMSVTANDFTNLELFGAETIVKVLKGIPPRKLPQVFVSTPRIILNIDTAKKIGYKPPFEILLIADEIHRAH